MPFTGLVGDIGVAALLPVFTSLLTGAVVAFTTGLVPSKVAFGVTGTLKVEAFPLFIGPWFVHVTVKFTVLQLQPLLIKLAGAVMPVGNVTVVDIRPMLGAVPILLTVTGMLLVCPAVYFDLVRSLSE